ncbi:hypothetical protein [Halomarina oriensis]|uniref:Uncharacterized protein n=1 Tax=Halomarina oriensis TaxID=671145 RepID=A0A6B0GG00_9EURY|nr:hypothetical protein [Halomarina oriensis]MWG33440.1 hypothetical protein [Halomarina oriensis]
MASNVVDADDFSSVRVLTPVNIGLVLLGIAYAVLTLADVIDYPWLSVVFILVGGGVVSYRAYRRDS